MYIIYIYIYCVYIYIYSVYIYIYIYWFIIRENSPWNRYGRYEWSGALQAAKGVRQRERKGLYATMARGPMGDLRASLGRGNQHNFTNKKGGGCLTNKYGGFKINYQQIWWFCQQTIDFTKKNTKNGVQPTVRPDKNACRSLQCSRSFVSNVSHVCKCKSRYPSITSRMCANAREDILA